MRIASAIVVFAILLPPLLSRADDKPQQKFACSVTILKNSELSECLDLLVTPDNDDALNNARAGCGKMLTKFGSDESQKENPGAEARTSSIDQCDTTEFLTACTYPKSKAGTTMTTRTYTIDKAFLDKDACAKSKGKWIENPAYKDYLHPPRVSAAQLHQEWRTNQAKAMQERGKKSMALYGTLYQVKVDDDEDVSVILNVSGFQRLVMVTGISSQRAAEFKPNAIVNFSRCILTGRTQLWDNPVVVCE